MGPPGTVCCFLCKGMIIYKKGDKSRFNNHMNNEHGVVFELDFLFATCKLNEVERVKVKDVIENELMVEQDENHEFNEESVKKQLRKIIPVANKGLAQEIEKVQVGGEQINCQFCDKPFSLETNSKRQFFKLHVKSCKGTTDDDDDIEVIKAVTAADKSVERLSKDSELEQISKKRRLSGNSVASSGVSKVSSTTTKPRQENQFSKPAPPPLVSNKSSEVTQFRVPSSVSSASSLVAKTPRKTPSLVATKTPRKSFPFVLPNSVSFKPSPVPQTPMKSLKSNPQHLQTPLKANLKTPMKAKTAPVLSAQTPMKTPRKSNAEPMVPPPSTRKRNSGYAPNMYPCDECDRGYASSGARSVHKKSKHNKTAGPAAAVKQEKPTEEQVMTSLPLLDQQTTSCTTLEETSAPITEPEKEVSPDDPTEPVKVTVRLFSCDGCGRSYPTSMKLKMHKKRSCKGGSIQNIKTESAAFKKEESIESNEAGEATLEERGHESIEPKDKSLDELTNEKALDTVGVSLNSETDEIQNMLMLDNADDDDDDDEDDDIELVDIIVDQKSKVQKEIPIGQIKNETVVEPSDSADDTIDDKKESEVETEKPEVETEKDDEEPEVEIEKDDEEPEVETEKDDEEPEVETEKVDNGPEELKTETSDNDDTMFEECLKSKYFMDHPSLLSKCSEGNLPTFQKTLKFRPGWKLKKNEVKKKNGERIPATHFLSPENVVIRSGLGVIEYLRIVGAKADYLNKLSLKLKVKPKNFENYIGKYMFDHDL